MTVMLAGKNMSYTCLSKSTVSVGCLESFSKFNKNNTTFLQPRKMEIKTTLQQIIFSSILCC